MNSTPETPSAPEPKQHKVHPYRRYGAHSRPTYSQAGRIIAKFGGESKFAQLVGINRTTAYRWQYARPVGTDGLIPSEMVERVQKVARAEGIYLGPQDWLPTRIDYAEADAIPTIHLPQPINAQPPTPNQEAPTNG